ncbi:MAG: phospholipid carrier-dependent glycosyltransferase [Planctomycetota bacterium]
MDPVTARPRGRLRAAPPLRWYALLPVLVPLTLLLGPGLYALDFGVHWDEAGRWIEPVARAYEQGTLLPGRYNYPSLGYALTLLATAPEAVGALLGGLDVREHVLAAVREPGFPLRLRALFLVASSLSVVWLYGLVLRWRGSWIEALVAASLLGSSWEVTYHARWVATDALVMQFGALVALCATCAVLTGERQRRWLCAAAVAAGLACGTKYPGGLLLAPVAVAACARATRAAGWSLRSLGRDLAAIAVLFAVTFVATTPGSLLEFEQFRAGIEYERYHYLEAGHGIYTVEAGLPHLARIAEYLGGHVLSTHAPAAWALSAAALVGLVATLRERPALALLLIAFPAFTALYLSGAVVLAVRNVLAVAPFLALFAARGLGVLASPARPLAVRGAVLGAAALILVGNAVHGARAAERTAHRGMARTALEVRAHVASRPGSTFALAPRARSALAAHGALAGLDNVTRPTDPRATHLVALPFDCRDAYETWEVGPLDMEVFGPLGFHFAYYPTAPCNTERILVLPMRTVRRVGLGPGSWDGAPAIGPALVQNSRR